MFLICVYRTWDMVSLFLMAVHAAKHKSAIFFENTEKPT